MSPILRIFILVVGITYCVFVFNLLLKKRINEKNTIVWISGSILIFLLSAYPEVLNTAANILHVSYPPALLFLMSTVVLMFIVLYQSMQISALNDKLKELSQFVALLQEEKRGRKEPAPHAPKNGENPELALTERER